MRLVYLSSPYSHRDPEVREQRFLRACEASAHLMKSQMVFSPIAHCHPIAKVASLPTDYDYWQAYNRRMISLCDELVVLMLDGWTLSKGVRAEVDIANELGKPVRYLVI